MKMFGSKQKDPREQVRESNRDIGRGVRDIDRELMGLKREEAQLIREIKAEAKKNNTAGAKSMAKNLVRLRGQMTKLLAAKGQLKGVQTQITTAAATSRVGTSMATATKAMQAAGIASDPRKVQQTMMEFSKENAKMEAAQEMIGDTLDDALDDDEMEEETDNVVSAVLDEIGVDLGATMGAAPRTKVAQRQQEPSTSRPNQETEGLEARLAALR
eukprot:jgi/Astpho2/1898/Aster-00417